MDRERAAEFDIKICFGFANYWLCIFFIADFNVANIIAILQVFLLSE